MQDALDRLHPAHVDELKRRMDRALAAHGYDAVVIHSGAAGCSFLDDRSYPFRANPHFLQWVPLQDGEHSFVAYAPGARPRLVFHQPADYWHSAPERPEGAWTSGFDVEMVASASEARALLPTAGRRVAWIGEWSAAYEDWGFAAVNPTPLPTPTRCRSSST